jgi:tripartite-type tricarboxylate transporter receptor subunit TctC
MQLFRTLGSAAILALAVAAIHGPAKADAVADFYKGRDVKIIIPAGMGGSFGLYSQFAAKHLGKHIPGNPNFIVQAMPGAGGLKGLTYVYNAAPKDGSVLMVPHSGVVFNTLLNPDAKFDALKFQYLGRIVSTDFVGMLHKRLGITKLDELKTKRVVFGATGPSNTTALSAVMFNRNVGTKIKMITGYKGLARVFQAIDQKELDGVSATITNPNYLDFHKKVAEGKPTDFVAIYTTSPKRVALFPDAPSLFEYKASEDDKRILAIIGSDGLVGRSLAFPPGVPEEFVAAFRKGFDAMAKDPAFLKEAKDRGIPLDILSGEEHFKLIAEVIRDVPQDKRKQAETTFKEILASMEK